jgi:hypothetical protein
MEGFCFVIPVIGLSGHNTGGDYGITTVYRLTLGPAQPPIQWLPVASAGRDAYHAPRNLSNEHKSVNAVW